MNVLFVCTGNTCRSPMAEAIFNHISAKNGKEHKAISRGTNVFFPQPINQKSVFALKEIGIDAQKHLSSQITQDDIKSSDLVLTMSSSHKMALKSAFPKYKDKIYTLSEKAYGREEDIEDPFGQNQEIYNLCLKSIYTAVDKIICMI